MFIKGTLMFRNNHRKTPVFMEHTDIIFPGQKFFHDYSRGGQMSPHSIYHPRRTKVSPYNCYPDKSSPKHSFPYCYQQPSQCMGIH